MTIFKIYQGTLRRTPYVLAVTPEGLGLFEPLTGKSCQFWRFVDENVTLLPGQDQDELVINGSSRGKHKVLAHTRHHVFLVH